MYIVWFVCVCVLKIGKEKAFVVDIVLYLIQIITIRPKTLPLLGPVVRDFNLILYFIHQCQPLSLQLIKSCMSVVVCLNFHRLSEISRLVQK